jgi:glycosyltransferase involved in cell wall biosynthesis
MALAQDPPLTSVILPCVGAPERVERSLVSLRAQTFRRFEILLVGSAGAEGGQWTSLFGDGRLRTIDAPVGLANAWSAGLAQAAGRYVCFVEPGDQFDPTYLEKCLFLLETLSLDLCAGWQRVNGESRETGPFTLEHLLARDVSAPAAVIRKARLSGLAPFSLAAPEQCHTWDLWIRLARSSRLGYIIPEALVDLGERTPTTSFPEEFLRQEESHFPHDGYDGEGMGSGQDRPPWLAPFDLFGAAERSGNPAILLAMPFLTVGGAEAVVSQLCRRLKPLGFRIFAITAMPAREVQGDTTGWFEEHTAGIYHLPRFLDASLWPAFVFYLIHQHSIRVLWLAGSSFIYDLLPPIKRLFPDLAVVDLLFNPVGHTTRFLKYNYLIDHVVTEYEGMKTWLIEHGQDDQSISVIPNGVDLDFYRPQPRKCWRTGGPRPEGSPFVAAFLGRLSKEKAPDLFVEIAARFKDRPDFEFLVCGAGPMEAQLRALCDRRGLRGRIHYLGLVPAREYLPCCDVLIVCSRRDGRPNIVMESMAMGIPVVASRVGGIPAMASEGKGCRLCEPEHVEGFCRAIEQLASDGNAYIQLCAAARRWAETHFSAADAGQRYAELFHGLIERRDDPLLRPVRLEDIFEAAGLKLRPGDAPVSGGRISAWLRFVRSLLLPKHALGNLRTVLLYRKLRRIEGAARDLRRYFDADYYSSQCPDAAALGIPIFWHYLVCGFWERRRPSLLFDTTYYLFVQQDVADAGVNPLIHYVVYGRSEGRTCRGGMQDPLGAEWT